MTPLNDSSDPVLRYFRSHSYKQFQPRPWPGALPSVHWIPECIWPTVTTGQGLKRKRASNRNTFHFSPGIKGYLGPLHYGVRVTFFISALCHIHSFCHHLDRFLLRPEGLQGCLDFFFFPFLYPCSPDAVFIIIIRSSILSFLPWCLFTFILSLICLISLLFLLIVNSKHLLFSMKWSRLLSLTRISLSRSNFVLLGTLLGSQLAHLDCLYPS